MNISAFRADGSVYTNCECIKGCAYDNSFSGAKSALLPIICANFGLLRDKCAQKRRLECLSPHIDPA